MIPRKVVQHGASTLTVSLPYKWTQQHGVKKGDMVFLAEQGRDLLLKSDSKGNEEKVVLKFTKDKLFFKRHLLNAYGKGYSEVCMEFEYPVPLSEIISQLEQLMGFEIVEQNDKRVVVRDVASIKPDEFEGMVKRLFIVCREFFRSLGGDLIPSSMEKEINKLTSYCLRGCVGLEPGETARYTTVVNLLEQIGDACQDLAEIGAPRLQKEIDGYFERLILEFWKTKPDIGLLKKMRKEIVATFRKQKVSWESVYVWQILDNLHHIEVTLQ